MAKKLKLEKCSNNLAVITYNYDEWIDYSKNVELPGMIILYHLIEIFYMISIIIY